MYCQHCGAELRTDARFCSKCGGEVPEATGTSPVLTTPVIQEAVTALSKEKSSWRVWRLVGVLLIVLCGAAFWGWRLISQPKLGDTIVNPIDKAEMVWVPGGTFTMGNPEEVGPSDEHPAHQVTLSGFWIFKYEVTVAQYRTFCAATGRALPDWPGNDYSWAGKSGWDDPALQQHPIVNVGWDDAKTYADWAGVCLPSEAQWEYAARGMQGHNYPWGGMATDNDLNSGWDETKCANHYNSYDASKSTWPVGSFPAGASWCGAQDMAGNALEWCADWYGDYASTKLTNPTGPASGDKRVLRGGSCGFINIGDFRTTFRLWFNPADRYINFGFRCVSRSPEP